MADRDLCVVVLTGTLADEAKLEYTKNGKALGKFNLAVVRPARENQRPEPPLPLVCWGPAAEALPAVKVGTRLLVEARLGARSWDTRNGETRVELELTAWNVTPLGDLSEVSGQVPPSGYQDPVMDPPPPPAPPAAFTAAGAQGTRTTPTAASLQDADLPF